MLKKTNTQLKNAGVTYEKVRTGTDKTLTKIQIQPNPDMRQFLPSKC